MAQTTTSSSPLDALPSYKKPPVNEVVCGMRFHIPDKLCIPHIGSLWHRFRAEYPIIQHVGPIASAKGEMLVDSATGLPLPRLWFINKSDDQLVQFQIDRFYFNWRRRQKDYPRYEHVIKKFENVLNTIIDFFDEFKFGEFKPVEYELSYINHIPKGKCWNTMDDIPRIFSSFVWDHAKSNFLPKPDKISWQTEFPLKENKGDLTISLKQATLAVDKSPLLILELKTRGIDESKSKEAVREWFDLAHEWIVRGFTDITTTKVQKIWEREDNV